MNVKWFSDHKQFIRDQCSENSNVSKENEYTEKLFLVKLHHRVNRGLNTWTDLYVLWRGDSIHRKHFMKRKNTQFLTSMSWILTLDVKSVGKMNQQWVWRLRFQVQNGESVLMGSACIQLLVWTDLSECMLRNHSVFEWNNFSLILPV